ncbi:hypothetical protein PG984_014505 [Apiospora sp. TS-2023a]
MAPYKIHDEPSQCRALPIHGFRTLFGLQKVKLWEVEKGLREKLDPVVHEFMNGLCFRAPLMVDLQEPTVEEAPDLEDRRPVRKEHCCNSPLDPSSYNET